MKKVVINNCFGGFSLSKEAFEWLIKKGWTVTKYDEEGDYVNGKADIAEHKGATYGDYTFAKWETSDPKLRTHPDIIEVVEKLKHKADAECADLKVVEIPNGVEFVIEEYDGNEHVAEKHRTWS